MCGLLSSLLFDQSTNTTLSYHWQKKQKCPCKLCFYRTCDFNLCQYILELADAALFVVWRSMIWPHMSYIFTAAKDLWLIKRMAKQSHNLSRGAGVENTQGSWHKRFIETNKKHWTCPRHIAWLHMKVPGSFMNLVGLHWFVLFIINYL